MKSKVTYIRNDKKKLQVTIVSTIEQIDGKNYVQAAWTFRSNKDVDFVKKLGRAIANDRLVNVDKEYSTSFYVDRVAHKPIMLEILKTILDSENTPKKYFSLLGGNIFRYSLDLWEVENGC